MGFFIGSKISSNKMLKHASLIGSILIILSIISPLNILFLYLQLVRVWPFLLFIFQLEYFLLLLEDCSFQSCENLFLTLQLKGLVNIQKMHQVF